MPATPAWLASVEALLNRSISQSTQAAAAARRLNLTSVAVEIEGVLRVRAAVAGDRLALLWGGDTAADATIAGSPLALLELIRGGPGGGSRRRQGPRAGGAGSGRCGDCRTLPRAVRTGAPGLRGGTVAAGRRRPGETPVAAREGRAVMGCAARDASPAKTSPSTCRRKAAIWSANRSSKNSSSASISCAKPPTASKPGSPGSSSG